MASLRSITGHTELTLRPYRVLEEGQPTWILTQLVFTHDGKRLVSTVISVTGHDLGRIEAGLQELLSTRPRDLYVVGSDDDFVFEVSSIEPPGHFTVSFWTGEPYTLMRGYRFVALEHQLQRFMDDLRSDVSSLAPPGPQPW